MKNIGPLIIIWKIYMFFFKLFDKSKTPNLCCELRRYDEMKDIENLWLRHLAEFLPMILCMCSLEPKTFISY